ncbi:lipocalin family protein [Capnocytophaga canimorsus]|uniref:lipocalin family protein n=1 Tax=Capnocytophaga canimorsus TaxID=28188 RepID=UPI0015620ACC|nr:lipocalin family protein [Capnocytophaga canimorsus]
MKRIYLTMIVLFAVFVVACEKDNGKATGNGDNNNPTSVDGVWHFDSQEMFHKGISQGKEENPQILECLKKNTITFEKGLCFFDQYIPVIGGSCKQLSRIQGTYQLTDKMLEIAFNKSKVKYEIAKKTDKEIVIKQENTSDPDSYFLDTYVKK